MRSLALEFAKKLQPWRKPDDPIFLEIHDALQLSTLCDQVKPPTGTSHEKAMNDSKEQEEMLMISCSSSASSSASSTRNDALCIFVVPNATTNGDGSLEHPVGCLHEALDISRLARKNATKYGLKDRVTKIVLREGIHELNHKPLRLSGETFDNHLQILVYPGEEAWISGGITLPQSLKWDRWDQSDKVWVTNLSEIMQNVSNLPSVPSVFTTDTRLIRARYPNGNPELDQWGYATPDKDRVSIPSDEALEWHKPPKGEVPTFDYIPNLKNDSLMDGYNMYASGHGGVCADQWGPEADSYWCSNYSQGGWAEVDREAAMTGQLQLPVGLTWNTTTEHGQHLSRLNQAKGGIVFAWHSQSWAMHMFQISSSSNSNASEEGTINQFQFEKGGGKQGGRNWCRCDQCTYAGRWCGQHQDPPDNTDTRLIGGSWIVENVLLELDQPGEFWYNATSHELYVYPNTTEGDNSWTNNLHFATLPNILELHNVSNVEIIGVNFRDSAATFMSDWSAPSGGDWSLHRGGTIFLENTVDVVIRNCTFRRLDSNAVFLSRRNRNVLIQKNVFEWLAENAIATWGETEKHDATKGDQPWNTMIYDNVMRELGIYEKQSSGVGQAKAALTDIRNNIMFNLPRAAINFNDMTGGGDKVFRNLLFNTCRESGDHGPINSWDRQPYLTKLRDGQTPSFDPLPREIFGNYIIANYGADQGVDNDDGSSWFHVRNNVFFDAAGVKMDYGGHDSVYENNLVMASGRKRCIGIGSFKAGHGDIIQNNRCAVRLDSISSTEQLTRVSELGEDSLDNVGGLGRCKESNARISNNTYYTPEGDAMFYCNDIGDEEQSLVVLQTYGIENSSISQKHPPLKLLVQWAQEMLLGRNEDVKESQTSI
ncbi:expressed unknown protein [Seminavis robusta]|uniref:Right handed beta helix domain-containing protein n=1 Tax=Seminavis robusta TaxID=568900 RepID=A0A9N8H335_9STRA|nr:expressed unknown protein [Seminavis robusta]|eukprot:Sro30_g019690.1 n/a (880) ;mRNA; f:94649-97751